MRRTDMSEMPETASAASPEAADATLAGRREFLIGLGRWSKIAISAAVLGGLAATGSDAVAGAWINRRGGWINGGGGWINGGGGGGGSWVNRRGLGGGGWINRR
jgi:hypothetical protein